MLISCLMNCNANRKLGNLVLEAAASAGGADAATANGVAQVPAVQHMLRRSLPPPCGLRRASYAANLCWRAVLADTVA